MTREEIIEHLDSIVGTYEILLGHGVNSDILDVDDIEAIKEAISALSAEPCREADDYENEIADLHNRLDIAEYDKERYKEEITTLEAEIKGEWIPVSERLPEYGVEVLCTVREMCDFPDDNEYDVPLTFIAQGHYINHEQKIFRGWYIKVRPDCSMGTDKVIAWMPLPEPYKAEKGGE